MTRRSSGPVHAGVVSGILSRRYGDFAHGNKAKSMRSILDTLVARFGRPTLAPLKTWEDAECEAFLTSLPGVGKKVARCVEMYSLGRRVFPVDTHCWRISYRLGWIRPSRAWSSGRPPSAVRRRGAGPPPPTPKDMDRLQAKIPPELRFSLHVNMISLGRDVCAARSPRCTECPIARYCRKVGV